MMKHVTQEDRDCLKLWNLVDLRAAVRSDETRTTHAASVAVPTVVRHGDQYIQNRHALNGRLPHGATETNMQPPSSTDKTNTRTRS